MKQQLRILKAQRPAEELVARFKDSYDKEAERKAVEWARKHVPPGYTFLQCAPTTNDPVRATGKSKSPHALEYRVELRIRPSFKADRSRMAALKREIAKLSPVCVEQDWL
jgi:hypothetical protein